MVKIRKYSWRIFLLFLGLAVSLALAGVFSVRAARYIPHRMPNEPIRPWMSLHYIAHSYKVPSDVLYTALGIAPVVHDERPISRLSRELNLPSGEIIAKLEDAILSYRAPGSTPPPSTP